MKIQAAQRLRASLYRYACFYRPPSLGAVPKGQVAYEPHVPGIEKARHGVVSYDRELTPAEVKQYELIPLGTNDREAVLPKVPEAVLRKVKEALATLRYCEEEHISREDAGEELTNALKVIDTFEKYCTDKRLAYKDALSELGGIPKIKD